MENKEEFVPVSGFEGYYEISKNGILYSCKRIIRVNMVNVHYKTINPRNMKPGKNPNGYKMAILSKHNIKKPMLIHRIIAIAFIPNPNNYPVVNHINGIRTDNRIENLEWCTVSENVNHAIKLGLTKKPKNSRPVYCSLTNKQWISISACCVDIGMDVRFLHSWLKNQHRNKTTILYKI